MKKLISDFINLFYPDLCLICNNNLLQNEEFICLSCLNEIPRTNFHLQQDNLVEKKFWGKVPVFSASSFFYFQKGSPFQKLLHELKYRGNKEIGEILGHHAALDFATAEKFKTIDIIIPVPLHPKKYAVRGYNQSEWISIGISKAINKPVDTTSLLRIKENVTQTRKTVFERYENTEGIFSVVNLEVLKGKHVLIVDDVLTTGSTLEACIQTLLAVEEIKISVFTLAIA